MKRIISALAVILALSSCDGMLDRTNYSKYDTSNFPTTQKDARQIVLGMYSALKDVVAATSPDNSLIFYSNAASDEMLGGSGIDRMMYSTAEGFQYAWKAYYEGIFRANYALSVIPEMDDALFDNVDVKNYYIGQAYFIRAWNNFQMAQTFETFPLLTSTEPVNEPRTDVETIYKSIADDLVTAINTIPGSFRYTGLDDGTAGLANKYTAEALLGRVWLFYTGFYKKSDLNGISKSQVATYLKDCRDHSGFGLVKDQREIWPYTNEYTSGFAYGADFDTYVSRNNLRWTGNHSKETVWALHFSLISNSLGFNRIGEFYTAYIPSPNETSYPMGSGYSMGKVNAKFVESWAKDPDYGFKDTRLWGTIVAAGGEAVGGAGTYYDWMKEDGAYVELPTFVGMVASDEENTFFWQKKYAVIAAYSDAGKSKILKNFFYATPVNDCYNHNLYDNRNDAIYIRFADVLLMIDELEETVTGINQIRARAGLEPYDSYTLERLQNERKYEFAFEGVRFNDLRRWYPDTAGKIIAENQDGGFITYRGKPMVYKEISGNTIADRYAKTRGFQRVPATQISLSNDVLDQNKGWEDTDQSWFLSSGMLPY